MQLGLLYDTSCEHLWTARACNAITTEQYSRGRIGVRDQDAASQAEGGSGRGRGKSCCKSTPPKRYGFSGRRLIRCRAGQRPQRKRPYAEPPKRKNNLTRNLLLPAVLRKSPRSSMSPPLQHPRLRNRRPGNARLMFETKWTLCSSPSTTTST